MSQYRSSYPQLDKTYYAGRTVPASYPTDVVLLEGAEQTVLEFDAAAPTNGGTESAQGSEPVTVKLVRNVHATTCAAGSLVACGTTAGKLYKHTAGMAATALMACIGVVWHRLSSGIPQHDLGWVVTKGPVWVNKVSGALSIGDLVAASTTAGKVEKFADTSTDDQTGAIVSNARNIVGTVIRAADSGDAQVEIYVGKL